MCGRLRAFRTLLSSSAPAALVVDTGMGPENGATVARVVAKLAPNNSRLFLTTTHYPTEHVTGEAGFPPGTVLIRNTVQQQELEKDGQVITDLFRGMSAQNKELLAGVVLRSPDVLFDSEPLSISAVVSRPVCSGSVAPTPEETR